MFKARHLAVFGLAVLGALPVISPALSDEAFASIPFLKTPVIQPVSAIRKLAFGHGEKMIFRFGWNDLPAAEMTMHVTEVEKGGRKFYHYAGAARTLPHVEWIYPLTDTVEAVLSADGFEPAYYSLSQDEKGKKTSTVVVNEAGMLKGLRRDHKNKLFNVAVTRDADYDPVTVAYLARSIDLEVGKSYTYKVFDGRFQYLLTLVVEKRETIRIKAGTYKAFKIRPSIVNISRPDKERKVKQASLWVSDDAYRVPLRLESEVFFGKVYGELVAFDSGR